MKLQIKAKKIPFLFIPAFLLTLFLLSCLNNSNANEADGKIIFLEFISNALYNANIPQNISSRILEKANDDPEFIITISNILSGDKYLWMLVDKVHPLPHDYEPFDLVELKSSSYITNRSGFMLRAAAARSLEEMAAASRRYQGHQLNLIVSSAYRSFSHQMQVYERLVNQMCRQAADRVSAKHGHSQHQLGLVVDFGSITDAFARTPENRWLVENASAFGWSLSYPDGYEEVTGYIWESWHYRYVGRELARFIDNYFDGIQHYALVFLRECENL